MVIRITIGVRNIQWDHRRGAGYENATSYSSRAELFREEIEAALIEKIGELADEHLIRISEIRIAEGRPTTTKGATNDE